MSVFTEVGVGELSDWLAACDAGELVRHEGVAGGVENTNYFVETVRGRFVLTLFEWMPAADAARTLDLTAALADAGLPVARPWPQPDGWLAPLAGKPAALADWIDGEHPATPTLAQCAAIGTFLGHLHSDVGAMLRIANVPDTRDDTWIRRTADSLGIDPGPLPDTRDLPQGVIHADLFRDNALFVGDTLGGVIDFHYACSGPLMYDLAVAALDWGLDHARLDALTAGYAKVREPGAAERQAFPALVTRAALRFWLSREHDSRNPRPGRAVMVKPPGEMRDRLTALRRSPVSWPE